jgi:hypothetical protein
MNEADEMNEHLKSAMRALVMHEAKVIRAKCGEEVDVGFAYLCLLKWQTTLMRAGKAIDLAEHVLAKAAA